MIVKAQVFSYGIYLVTNDGWMEQTLKVGHMSNDLTDSAFINTSITRFQEIVKAGKPGVL